MEGVFIYFFLCIASFCCCVTFVFGFAGVGGVSEMEIAWEAEVPLRSWGAFDLGEDGGSIVMAF